MRVVEPVAEQRKTEWGNAENGPLKQSRPVTATFAVRTPHLREKGFRQLRVIGLSTKPTERHNLLLDVQPDGLHQRIPVILGSRNEVARIERYHLELDAGIDRPFESPLFNERSLFRPEARV